MRPVRPTADFPRAAAGVVSQADDGLSRPAAHGRRHAGAVVLHRDDGVVVASVHAAAVSRGFPNLAVRTRKAGAVGAGCQQTTVVHVAGKAKHLLFVLLELASHHTSQVGCREQNRAGGGASPRGRRSPPSGLSTAPGLSRSRGLGRTERCRRSDTPDTAERQDR